MKKDERWFRFYARMIDSPQVLELSDAEFRLIVSMWALACDERGSVPFSAAALRRRIMPDHTTEDVSAMLEQLVSLDLLSVAEDGFVVPRWDVHQYVYASQTPEAKAAQKEKERVANNGNDPKENGGKCRNNVASMSLEEGEEVINRIDSEAEAEDIYTPPSPNDPLARGAQWQTVGEPDDPAALILFRSAYESAKSQVMPDPSPSNLKRLIEQYNLVGEERFKLGMTGFFSGKNGETTAPADSGYSLPMFLSGFQSWETCPPVPGKTARGAIGPRLDLIVETTSNDTLAAMLRASNPPPSQKAATNP